MDDRLIGSVADLNFVIPVGAWPSLLGHFVCPALGELFILDEAPA